MLIWFYCLRTSSCACENQGLQLMSLKKNFLIFVINNVELSCIDDELNLKVTMDENILCAFICAKVLIILQCMPKTLENKLWFFQIVF